MISYEFDFYNTEFLLQHFHLQGGGGATNMAGPSPSKLSWELLILLSFILSGLILINIQFNLTLPGVTSVTQGKRGTLLCVLTFYFILK